jgi:hypothetical protein
VAKLILLSVVIAALAIPLIASRASDGRSGLRWTLIALFVFNLFYVFAVRFIYPHFV